MQEYGCNVQGRNKDIMNIRLAILITAVAVAPLAFSAEEPHLPRPAANPRTKVQKVGVDEFDKLRQNKENLVIDVRTEKEFKAGHIPGAINIDVRSSEFEEKVQNLDKNKTYLVHCASGGRSANACVRLEKKGFKHLYDLAPGFKGWEKAGKPVEN